MRACDGGVGHACLYLAEDARGTSGREADVARSAQRGCQTGAVAACDLMARLQVALQDDTAAVQWATEACRMGSDKSCWLLVEPDAELPGIPVDDTKRRYRARAA